MPMTPDNPMDTSSPESTQTLLTQNTLYAFASCMFNVSAILMVAASEDNNDTQKRIAQCLIVLAMTGPMIHATYGWKVDEKPITNSNSKTEEIMPHNNWPGICFATTFSTSIVNIFNEDIYDSLLTPTLNLSDNEYTYFFFFAVMLDIISSLGCDAKIRNTLLELSYQHIQKDPTVFLRLWKSCAGTIKSAMFSSVGDNPDAGFKVQIISIVDPLCFIFLYTLINSQAPTSKFELPKPALAYMPWICLIGTLIATVASTDTLKDPTEHAVTLIALMSLFIESSTMLFIHPNSPTLFETKSSLKEPLITKDSKPKNDLLSPC